LYARGRVGAFAGDAARCDRTGRAAEDVMRAGLGTGIVPDPAQ